MCFLFCICFFPSLFYYFILFLLWGLTDLEFTSFALENCALLWHLFHSYIAGQNIDDICLGIRHLNMKEVTQASDTSHCSLMITRLAVLLGKKENTQKEEWNEGTSIWSSNSSEFYMLTLYTGCHYILKLILLDSNKESGNSGLLKQIYCY